MEQKRDEIELLALKYCEGTANLQEIKTIEKWMTESDANYQYVKQLYITSLAINMEYVSDSVSVEKALSDVHTKIQGEKSTQSVTLKWARTLYQRWAAILFIPITISLLVLLSHRIISDEESLITVSTNKGMVSTFRLPDSTLVCLNAQSKLIYPTRFVGNTRNVILEGEAYFEVSQNPKKRFVLSTLDKTKVEVLGTKFNVEAYENLEKISTTLLEGSVHFLYDYDGKARVIPLQPCEKLVYPRNGDTPKIYKTSCRSELAWKDGKVIFDNTSFQEALRMLEKRFNVQFIVSKEEFWKYHFTGTFVTQRLEQILENFQISSSIKWRYLRESSEKEDTAIIELY